MKKNISFYLIVNVKNGSVRVTKRKPRESKISPFEVTVSVNLKVTMPEKKELKANGEIKLTEQKVSDMVIEEI